MFKNTIFVMLIKKKKYYKKAKPENFSVKKENKWEVLNKGKKEKKERAD